MQPNEKVTTQVPYSIPLYGCEVIPFLSAICEGMHSLPFLSRNLAPFLIPFLILYQLHLSSSIAVLPFASIVLEYWGSNFFPSLLFSILLCLLSIPPHLHLPSPSLSSARLTVGVIALCLKQGQGKKGQCEKQQRQLFEGEEEKEMATRWAWGCWARLCECEEMNRARERATTTTRELSKTALQH